MNGQVSILHPTTCGFAKIAVYELVSANISLDDRISKYEIAFEECMENFAVLPDTHRRNFPKITEKIRAIGKSHKDIKNKVLDEFSMKAWKKLPLEEKSRHSLLNCKGCTTSETYKILLNAFPVSKHARAHNSHNTSVNNMSQLSNITQEIYNNANNEFQKSFPGFQFSEAQAMLPGLNLLKTPTHTKKRKTNRMAATKFKKSVECYK